MKKVYTLIFLVALGCNTSPKTYKIEKNETIDKIDSILIHNQQILIAADSTSKKGDSSIAEKVEQTVKQMTILKQENQQLKKENNVLKVQLNDTTDDSKPFKLLPVSSDQNNR
jgi:hypothetical protein